MRLITRGGVSLRARLRLIPAKTTQGVMPKGAPSPQGSQVVVVVAFAVAFAPPRVGRFLGRSLRLCHCTNENAIRGYFVGLRPNKNNHGGFSLAFSGVTIKSCMGLYPKFVQRSCSAAAAAAQLQRSCMPWGGDNHAPDHKGWSLVKSTPAPDPSKDDTGGDA